MKRLKAWFQSVVVAEVRKAIESVLAEFRMHIGNHVVQTFNAEREKLATERTKVEDDLRTLSNEIHANAMTRLASEMRQKMDEELKAFEARVNHTLTACIKDEPSHWKADEEALKTDIELRTPKR